MEKFLVDHVLKTVQDIEASIDKLEKSAGTRRITEYLNIEHGIGKYHAYMDCLEELNIDKWAELHTRVEKKIKKALAQIEGIYQAGNDSGLYGQGWRNARGINC